MSAIKIVATVGFMNGIIPAAILLRNMLRTDWNRPDNPGGRLIVPLTWVIIGSAVLGLSVTLIPDWARSEIGEWIRIAVRFVFSLFVWVLLLSFYKAQRRGLWQKSDQATKKEYFK